MIKSWPNRAAFLLPVLAIVACSAAKDGSRGFRTLDAVVVDREYEPPGTGSASFAGSGNWYLVFEATDGEATARYRFPVTRQQYQRFPEGTRVQLVMADERLREIRPVP